MGNNGIIRGILIGWKSCESLFRERRNGSLDSLNDNGDRNNRWNNGNGNRGCLNNGFYHGTGVNPGSEVMPSSPGTIY